MPTFNDPYADARETVGALRGLVTATGDIDDPAPLDALVEEMQTATQQMQQVLDNLGSAHQQLAGRATGGGDPNEGRRLASEAATALRQASGHLRRVEINLEAASEQTGQIDWRDEDIDHRWISVVFLQGEEAEPVLEIIDRQGTGAAVEFLAGWGMADETEEDALENGYVYDTPPQGKTDRLATRDVYTLTYNPDLGYVGLTRPMNVMPDPVLLHLVNPCRRRPMPRARPPWRLPPRTRRERRGGAGIAGRISPPRRRGFGPMRSTTSTRRGGCRCEWRAGAGASAHRGPRRPF